MSETAIAFRTFEAADQKRFADCSGDFNPIHMDPIAARRTQAGLCVVHGVHVALWALDVLIEIGRVCGPIATLKVQFSKFVPVGEEVALKVVGEASGTLRAAVSIDEVVVVSLALGRGPVAGADVALLSTIIASPSKTPKTISLSEISGCEGWLPEMPEKEVVDLFPHVAKLLGAGRLEAIARLSTLVGMNCPGLYSIFSGFDITMTAEASGISGLSFMVENLDDRFQRAEVAVVGHGIRGKVTAFVRPQPVMQASLQSLAGKVAKHEFRGTTALIVGGSRGLGATTARIIAAGGGRVVITYVVGEMDANEIAAEIGPDACRVLPYDVRKQPLPQLATLQDDINQLYYFSTPHIAHQRENIFTPEHWEKFCQFYINGFYSLCIALRARQERKLSVFYPSSVYINDRPRGMLEYSMAKVAGELLCAEINRFIGETRVIARRLPRVLTDQTASVMSLQHSDAVQVMLPIIREMRSEPSSEA
jgi:NAD(P)-dependent dehydrogenase (short-subunit alcohol dehydrogenase family)